MKHVAVIAACLLCLQGYGQTSYFNQGFLRQGSAQLDRDYLGITNGSGTGTVTTFSAGVLSPLFTTAVANPTTTPALSFSQISQNQNLVFASPDGVAGVPTFRALVAADLPGGGGGTVTTFTAGNANPLFTTSVANPNTTPALTFTLLYTPLSDVTNAGTGFTSLINASNTPIPAFKSISAGANVTLTDNGTNIVIASTGGGGGSGMTNILDYETNNVASYRTVAGDVAEGAVTTFTGFGDTLTFASSGGGGSATTTHSLISAIPGTWLNLQVNSGAGAIEFAGSQTFNAMIPYSNSVWSWHTYVFVRNTNSVRIAGGFSAAALATTLGTDTLSTNIVEFRYSSAAGDTTWHGYVSNGTNSTTVDTTVALVPDTGYYLRFDKIGTNVTFTVNRGNAVTATTNVPNAYVSTVQGMAFFYGMDNASAGAKTNFIHYFGYDQEWLTK